MQTAKLPRVAGQRDVGATASHVRRNRHAAKAACLGNDARLTLMVLGVEHVVLDALALE